MAVYSTLTGAKDKLIYHQGLKSKSTLSNGHSCHFSLLLLSSASVNENQSVNIPYSHNLTNTTSDFSTTREERVESDTLYQNKCTLCV